MPRNYRYGNRNVCDVVCCCCEFVDPQNEINDEVDSIHDALQNLLNNFYLELDAIDDRVLALKKRVKGL